MAGLTSLIVAALFDIHYIPDCLLGLLLLLDNFSKTAICETALPSRANPSILTAKQHDTHRKLMLTKEYYWNVPLGPRCYLHEAICQIYSVVFNKSDPFTQMSLSVGIDRE